MLDFYYNNCVVNTKFGEAARSLPKRPYSQGEIDALNLTSHLNARVDVVGDQYVLRAFKFVLQGLKYFLPEDVTFKPAGEDFCGWLVARSAGGPASLVVVDEALLKYGSSIKELRDEYYRSFGHPINKLFYTIRCAQELGKPSESEELCVDMNRCLIADELPAELGECIPTERSVEAFQESNSSFLRSVRAKMDEYNASRQHVRDMAASVGSKTWEQLDEEERSFVLRRAAENLGIISK